MGSSFWSHRLLKTCAMPLLFAAVGMAMTFYPTLLSAFARIQNDAGDTRHLNYVLEHSYRWVTRAPANRDLWSPPIFYPELNTAAYTELLLGVVPFYLPWRLIGFAPDTAFQLWMLTISALNFAAMYWFLRRCFQFSAVACCFGSFLFAFGSPRINQLNHQFLLPQFFTVLALYSACELFRLHSAAPSNRRCLPYVIAFFASVAAQVYASYYHGWFLAFALTIALVCALAIASVRAQLVAVVRSHLVAIAIAVVLGAAALAPLALHHLAAAQMVGFRQFIDAEGMLPRFQSWFYMGEENWLYGWTAKHAPFIYLPMEWEQRLGFGPLTTVIVVWSLLRERDRPGLRIMMTTWLVILMMSTMYRWQFSPWKWVFHWVPGANGIRAVSRIGLLATIPAGVGLALFVDQTRAKGRHWIAVAIGLFCLLEQGRRSLSYEKEPVRRETASIVASIPPECQAFFYSCVGDKPAIECDLDAMWAALETNIPTVNGYSSNNPPRFGALAESAVRSQGDEERLRLSLEAWSRQHGLTPQSVCWLELPRPVWNQTQRPH
jgi:hypothetical protein